MSSKKITLKTSDNETFEVTEEVALKSQTIKHLIEDECADNVIPLPNVTSETLAKVIEYCKKHVEEGSGDDAKASLKTFDEAFIKAVDLDTLYDLILAANYLHIEGLIDLTCRTVAGIIHGKPPEQIRRTFNIVNDFTPEEEKEIYRGNKWAYSD